MGRVYAFWTAIGLLSLAAGCSMCAHPYDNCGPTALSGNGARCCSTVRAGSILSSSDVLQSAAVDGQIETSTPSADVNVPLPPMPAPSTTMTAPTAPQKLSFVPARPAGMR